MKTIAASEIAHLTTAEKLEVIGYSKETIASFVKGLPVDQQEKALQEQLEHCLHVPGDCSSI